MSSLISWLSSWYSYDTGSQKIPVPVNGKGVIKEVGVCGTEGDLKKETDKLKKQIERLEDENCSLKAKKQWNGN